MIRLVQRELDVDRDDDVYAHFANCVDGDVASQAPIYEPASIGMRRRKNAGRRHTRPHRENEVSLRHDMCFTGFDIRSHCAKRRGQLVKIADIRDVQRLLSQYPREFLA